MLDSLLQFGGRLHPLVLHLPIGLIAGLVACELIALARGRSLDLSLRKTLAWLAAAAAAVTAATGLLLSREDAYSGDTLQLHLWLGISTAVGMLMAALLVSRNFGRAYAAVLGLTAVIAIPAGHLGGVMTHGEDFLLEPFRDHAPATVSATSPDVYQSQIAPIFAARCVNCHGPTRHKGGLRLDSPEGILAGGDSGSAIERGDVANSEILVRLKLPPDDDDHMPPKAKPQPTPEEIMVLERWIAQGAPFEGEASPSPVAPQPDVPPSPPAIPRPSQEAIESLRAAQVHVEVAMPETGLLWVSFAAAAATTDEQAAILLAPVKDLVADLSLARTATSDATLSLVSEMTKLRRLDISGTAVTSHGLASLGALPELEELRVTRMKLDDAAAEPIRSMKALRRLYAWNSGISDAAMASIRESRPDLVINTGAEPDTALATEPDFTLSNTAPIPGVPAAPSLEPVNAVCPVSGSPVNAQFLVVNENRVVGFCCEKCAARFLLEPSKFTVKPK